MGEIGGKWWKMRLKNTYEKCNVIEIHKKVSQIEWKLHKLSLKPSENKKFKRNECRKVGEMNENEWKMTLKYTYETYNAFKKSQKVSNPEENWTKLPSKPSKNKKFKRNECRKLGEMNEKYTQKQSNETWKKKT